MLAAAAQVFLDRGTLHIELEKDIVQYQIREHQLEYQECYSIAMTAY